MRTEDTIFAAFILMLSALCGATFYLDSEDKEKWAEFSAAHKYREVSRIKGDVFNTVGLGGNGQLVAGVGSTSDKTGYLCDDGKTYYR